MNMTEQNTAGKIVPVIAPVELPFVSPDAVSHSLAVLASVYHYNHWIYTMVRDFLGESVVEVGSGIGNITRFMLDVKTLVCLEPFEPYREYIASRFSRHLNVKVVPHRIEECPNPDVPEGGFRSVVCLNVLEHIEDDIGVLAKCRRLLQPGGNVIILVPALPLIYGPIDRAMGHVKRYTKGSLRAAMAKAGFQVISSRYMNFVGVFGWWWEGRVLGREKIPEKKTRMFNRCVPFLSAVERIVPPLLGQSLVMVGKAGGGKR